MSKVHFSNPKPSTGDGMTQKINRAVAYVRKQIKRAKRIIK
jgi:hypothetical protein